MAGCQHRVSVRYCGLSDDQHPIRWTSSRTGDDEADISCVTISGLFVLVGEDTRTWRVTLSALRFETMSTSQVHIAGVGIAFSSRQDLADGAIKAGARALLDAGITYAKVQLSVACSLESAQARIPQECFRAFGRQKAPTCSMDSFSALHILAQCVRTGETDCAMLVGLDQVSTCVRRSGSLKLTDHTGSCRPKRRYRKGA